MRAYERFLHYAQIDTASDPNSGKHPSTATQFDLAKLLVEQLLALGVADARVDEKCYVYGTLPATAGLEDKPALGLIAHMDTAPDASGKGVCPVLHENYDGGDVLYPLTGALMTVEKFPFLAKMKGETLITSDGTTLLGVDDKAGIAEIMTVLETIVAEDMPHCKLCIGFTPDEEIGEGADYFDVKGFGAAFAYTVDGGDAGEIEYDNFNAAGARITLTGFAVHPGSAKNTMVNACNLAMEFHSALPAYDRPEHTEAREGFYHLGHMKADGTHAELLYIIRDHDMGSFEARKATLLHLADCMNEKYGAGTAVVELRDSYYNMLEKIKPHFHLVETAREAIKMAGLTPDEPPVRGGTDGARLSYEGLPCPNLGTGGYNYHGPFECTTAERMDKAAEIVLNIVKLYSK